MRAQKKTSQNSIFPSALTIFSKTFRTAIHSQTQTHPPPRVPVPINFRILTLTKFKVSTLGGGVLLRNKCPKGLERGALGGGHGAGAPGGCHPSPSPRGSPSSAAPPSPTCAGWRGRGGGRRRRPRTPNVTDQPPKALHALEWWQPLSRELLT